MCTFGLLLAQVTLSARCSHPLPRSAAESLRVREGDLVSCCRLSQLKVELLCMFMPMLAALAAGERDARDILLARSQQYEQG